MTLTRSTLLVAALLVSAGANADVIGIHGPSTHFTPVDAGVNGPNNSNYGIYYRKDFSELNLEVGSYYNSHRKTTVYAGTLLEFTSLPLTPALLFGVATGYSKTVIPFVTASISYPITPKLRARLEWTGSMQSKIGIVMHTRLEWQL